MAGAPQFASLYVGDLHPDVTEALMMSSHQDMRPFPACAAVLWLVSGLKLLKGGL